MRYKSYVHLFFFCFFTITSISVAAFDLQSYPIRPIRIIVPQSTGGTADSVARTLAPGLSLILGQQCVIDNRGGAGGIIGTELAARASPDGYTISLNGSGPMTILPNIQKQLPYDPIKDFSSVSKITISPFALVIHPSVPVKSIKDLIALAISEPTRLNYASAGSGSVVYLGMELLKSLSGIRILHVPYKGSAQGMTDVLAGNVALMLFAVNPAMKQVAVERLRILAISSAKRSPQYPNIPTVSESGIPGYDVTTWTGLFVPAKTSRQLIRNLKEALSKTLQTPGTRKLLEAQGADIVIDDADIAVDYVKVELENNAKIIKNAGHQSVF